MSDGQGHRITSDVEKGVTSVSKAVGSHRCCNLSKQCRVEVHLVEQNESSALGNAHVRARFDAIDVHAGMSEKCGWRICVQTAQINGHGARKRTASASGS